MSKRDAGMLLFGFACGCIAVGAVALGIGAWMRGSAVSRRASSAHFRAADHPAPTGMSYALDGYCPVTLIEDGKWKLGDTQYCEQYEQELFVFASLAELELFQQHRDRYIPAFSGNDVVLAADSGATKRGKRQHGLMHNGTIFLFASEDSLDRFSQDPQRYVAHSSETAAHKDRQEDAPRR